MAVEMFFMTKSPRKNVPDVGIAPGGRLHAKRTRFWSSYRARSIWWLNILVGIMDQCDAKINLIKYV